jgi:hypothetical protein
LQQLVFICSNWILFAATGFCLQQLYIVLVWPFWATV